MLQDSQKEEIGATGEEYPPPMLPVYPGLVFREFLTVLGCLLVLLWLGLVFEAPLGSPADPDFTPNPAKAPWYFLGIQELLVYFDPWLAGVVVPLLIILGLISIPLLDNDPSNAGRYAFKQRILASLPFTAGLLILALLTVMSAWFRGSNWDWYWPWEDWSMARPARSGFRSLPSWLGLSLMGAYYSLGLLLPITLWRRRFERWGRVRYLVYFFMVLTMGGVIIKVLLRLLFNVRYLVQTPWFNI